MLMCPVEAKGTKPCLSAPLPRAQDQLRPRDRATTREPQREIPGFDGIIQQPNERESGVAGAGRKIDGEVG